MKKTCLASLALAGLLASGAANAQFFGTVGYTNVNPDSDNGALAGLDVSASNSNGLVYGGGVDFFVAENLFLRADVSKLDFDTDVNVETLGDVGTANVDPLVIGFSLGYQF